MMVLSRLLVRFQIRGDGRWDSTGPDLHQKLYGQHNHVLLSTCRSFSIRDFTVCGPIRSLGNWGNGMAEPAGIGGSDSRKSRTSIRS